MMRKGRIIFLNGVTSSGKTSIVEALQEREDAFFYVVANDLFQEMIGEKYLRDNYWKYLGEVIVLMYHTAKLFSDLGKNVIIDGILVEQPELQPHYERMKNILKDNPLEVVEVYCPLEICRKRNLERGNRYEGQSQEQYEIMAEDIEYSCRVETHIQTSEECAEIIMQTLFT
jgi:chloramphenicol 3-O phosphotransferase